MKPKKVPESNKEIDQKLVQIGEKVRKLRKEKRANYEDFARENNINKVTLNKIEKGESVSLRLFLTVIQKLGISLQDFFKKL
jgi:transcriptional regulator with XRE-family HTH domain